MTYVARLRRTAFDPEARGREFNKALRAGRFGSGPAARAGTPGPPEPARAPLSIVLFSLFVVFWLGQTYVGWEEFKAEAQEHGESPTWLGDTGYVWAWAKATLENWQSEFLQLFCMVVFTAFLIHKGSAESRDSNDRMEQMLQRIERKVAELERDSGKRKAA